MLNTDWGKDLLIFYFYLGTLETPIDGHPFILFVNRVRVVSTPGCWHDKESASWREPLVSPRRHFIQHVRHIVTTLVTPPAGSRGVPIIFRVSGLPCSDCLRAPRFLLLRDCGNNGETANISFGALCAAITSWCTSWGRRSWSRWQEFSSHLRVAHLKFYPSIAGVQMSAKRHVYCAVYVNKNACECECDTKCTCTRMWVWMWLHVRVKVKLYTPVSLNSLLWIYFISTDQPSILTFDCKSLRLRRTDIQTDRQTESRISEVLIIGRHQ